MSQLTNYIKESYDELLSKVTWPTWKSLQESSVLVFVASLLIAGAVFTMDWTFGVNPSNNTFLLITGWPGIIRIFYEPSSVSEIGLNWNFINFFVRHLAEAVVIGVVATIVGLMFRKRLNKN